LVGAHHQHKMQMWCVRTVRLKMLFAEGPKIAAAMRDMLATLGPGVCCIVCKDAGARDGCGRHAPKREKVWGMMDGIPDESPKTLGILGAGGPTQQTKTNLENIPNAVFGGLAPGQLRCRGPRERRGRGRICRHRHGLMIQLLVPVPPRLHNQLHPIRNERRCDGDGISGVSAPRDCEPCNNRQENASRGC
jgi:hypothetical protein